MKITLGRWVICSAERIKRKAIQAIANGAEKNEYYWQIVGIYDTRIFGVVFYRCGEYEADWDKESLKLKK